MADSDIVPFKVDIPQSEVDRLKRKLQDTRLPPKEIVPGAGKKYGKAVDASTSTVVVATDTIPQDQPTNGPAISTTHG
jgi:hypothetical protein